MRHKLDRYLFTNLESLMQLKRISFVIFSFSVSVSFGQAKIDSIDLAFAGGSSKLVKLNDLGIQFSDVIDKSELQSLAAQLNVFINEDQESTVNQNSLNNLVRKLNDNFLGRNPRLSETQLGNFIDTLTESQSSRLSSLARPSLPDSNFRSQIELNVAAESGTNFPNSSRFIKDQGQLLYEVNINRQTISSLSESSDLDVVLLQFAKRFHLVHETTFDFGGAVLSPLSVESYDLKKRFRFKNPRQNEFVLLENEAQKIQICLGGIPLIRQRCQTLKLKKIRINNNLKALIIANARSDGPEDPRTFFGQSRPNSLNSGIGILVLKKNSNQNFSRFFFSAAPSEDTFSDIREYLSAFRDYEKDQKQSELPVSLSYLQEFNIFSTLSGQGFDETARLIQRNIYQLTEATKTPVRNQCIQSLRDPKQLSDVFEAIKSDIESYRASLPAYRMHMLRLANSELDWARAEIAKVSADEKDQRDWLASLISSAQGRIKHLEDSSFPTLAESYFQECLLISDAGSELYNACFNMSSALRAVPELTLPQLPSITLSEPIKRKCDITFRNGQIPIFY